MDFGEGDELQVLNDFLAWCSQHKVNISPKVRHAIGSSREL